MINLEKNNSIEGEWLLMPEVIRYGKMSRATVYNLLAAGALKSFVRKTHPWSKSGRRLISRSSIDEYYRQQAEAAGAL